MTSFDNPGLFYQKLDFCDLQERFFAADEDVQDGGRELIAEHKETVESFRNFIREYNVGGFGLVYRDQLKRNCSLGKHHVEISMDDLKGFSETLANKLHQYPTRLLSALEEAAKLTADEVMQGVEDVSEIHDIQVTLRTDELATSIRQLKSAQVSRLVKISGIIVAASQVRAKATRISIQCRTCRHTVTNLDLKPGLDGFTLPRTCGANQTAQLQRCPVDPYHIIPDKCHCIDFQTLKLQENPEDVPHGEMPRHMQLYCDRHLTDRVAPGNRVMIVGIYSIKRMFQKQKTTDRTLSGIRAPYIRVLGIHVQTSGPGRVEQRQFTIAEEKIFKDLAKKVNIYDLISQSIAPSIYGAEDIKKSIACLLFGGSRKRLPDGLTRRGDINILLLGDPGTAKSQLLKFVEKVAPIAVYTSGKGSSAAGLTASVNRDPQSVLFISVAPRSFIMEGGAMVLADGGIVCIDEFDKMREDDRVAIHEAMEQQTISIAKAGITTTLNSRCSVLAAANSVYGRWDDSKGDENIDFMPTILSRFDMIYIVKDTHDVTRDTTLAKHVISVHVNASSSRPQEIAVEGELSLELLKKYIAYCRVTCAPRLSASAGQKLIHNYVRLRNPAVSTEHKQTPIRSVIPITVRQLEAVIRISESLAKMELLPFATERHVDEALRLFRVSTIEAAASGNLIGIEGFTSAEDQESFSRIEHQLKKRFALGTHVSEYLIVQDFVRQNYPELLIKKVIQSCIRRGELQYRMQRKMLYRIK
uniref:DNA replication licensing factor MCM5 n=1 Tax=Setaria digitata TaxID=48799 RepID=A0A915PJE3_9BILA